MARLDDLLTAYIEHRLRTGQRLEAEVLCRDEPELIDALGTAIRSYEAIDATLTAPVSDRKPTAPAPRIEGFRVVERIGGGGGGEVFKVEDLELGRVVAAKVIRRDSALGCTAADFLRGTGDRIGMLAGM